MEQAEQIDNIYETIREFLPDIENELRKEITHEMEQIFEEKYQALIQQTKEDSRKELDSIINEIKQEAMATYNERVQSLESKEAELLQLKNEYKSFVEQEIKEELRLEFEREKDILLKTLIEEMSQDKDLKEEEAKLKERLQREAAEEIKKELQRKEKLAAVNLKKKLEIEKKALQESYEREWRSKIEEAKKEVEREKIEISRLKSVENLKLKKMEEERKGFKKELEEQKKYYEKIIEEMSNKMQESLEKEKKIEEKGEEEFEKKYLMVEQDEKKDTRESLKNNLKEETDIFNSNNNENIKTFSSFEKNQSRIEQMIEPLSPPKLLYIEEENVISYEKNNKISNNDSKKESFFQNIQNQNTSSSTKNNNINNSNKKMKRTLIGEYNSKHIAEEIIKIYTERKGESNPDISKMISKSIAAQEISPSNRKQQREEFLSNEENSKKMDETSFALREQQQMNTSNQNRSFFLNEREQIRIENKNKRVEEFSAKYNQLLTSSKRNNMNTLTNTNTQSNFQTRQKTKVNNTKNDEKSDNKYKEIIKKYLKSNSENQERQVVLDENLKINSYESLFLINKNDDPKVKEMKKLRKDIYTRIIRDYNLEEKYLAMEIYLKNQMFKNIKCKNIEYYGLLQNNLNILLEIWFLNDTSFKERIEFIKGLENLLGEGEEINKKIENEIDYQQNLHKLAIGIIEKLRERMVLRAKLNIDDFSYSINKKIYVFLHNLCLQLEDLLYEFEETQEKEFIWRGANTKDILKCEFWEHEYLEKEEMRKEIYNRMKKKIL